MALFSLSGKRPATLGVRDGKLSPCPASPNCVCSQAEESDAEHRIEPFTYNGSPEEAIAKLKQIISSMKNAQVIEASADYLYAEFTSALMGYVDDVEFYGDRSTHLIQVRSASRLGRSDLGVNRKRVEAIRGMFGS
jgi:uncharacterized protein (DUF1499 family)